MTRNKNPKNHDRHNLKNLILSSRKNTNHYSGKTAARSNDNQPLNDDMTVKTIINQALELPIITQADYNCHKCGTYVKIGQIHTCYRPVKLGRIWLTKDKENEKVKTYVNYAIKRY